MAVSNTPQSPPFMRGHFPPPPMESPIPYPPFFPTYSHYLYNPYPYNPQPQFHQPQPPEEQLEALVRRVISEQSLPPNSTVTAPVTTSTIATTTMASATPQLPFPCKDTLVFVLDLCVAYHRLPTKVRVLVRVDIMVVNNNVNPGQIMISSLNDSHT